MLRATLLALVLLSPLGCTTNALSGAQTTRLGTGDGGYGGIVDLGYGPGSPDGGPVDAGPYDGGPIDAGPIDAGPYDGGPVDAGPYDAGPVDIGHPRDGGHPHDAGPRVDLAF